MATTKIDLRDIINQQPTNNAQVINQTMPTQKIDLRATLAPGTKLPQTGKPKLQPPQSKFKMATQGMGKTFGAIMGAISLPETLLGGAMEATAAKLPENIEERLSFKEILDLSNPYKKDVIKHAFSKAWSSLKGDISEIGTEKGIKDYWQIGKGGEPLTKGENVGATVVSVLLDLAINPTTYLTFGGAGGVKIGSQGLTKAGTKAYATLIKSGVAKGLTREAATIAAREAMEAVAKKGGVEAGKLLSGGGVRLAEWLPKVGGQSILPYEDIAKFVDPIAKATGLGKAYKGLNNWQLTRAIKKAVSPTYGVPEDLYKMGKKAKAFRAYETVKKGEELIKPLKELGTFTKLDAEQIFNAITKPDIYKTSPEKIQKAADIIGKRFDDIRAQLVSRGVDIGYLDNYAPQFYEDMFGKEFVDNLKNFAGELPGKAEKISKTITEGASKRPKEFFEYTRTLFKDVDAAEAAGVKINKNIFDLLTAYEAGASRINAFMDIADKAKAFGVDLTKGADDFIKSQPVYYHGTPHKFSKWKLQGGKNLGPNAIFFSDSESAARYYAQGIGSGKDTSYIKKAFLPDVKLFDYENSKDIAKLNKYIDDNYAKLIDELQYVEDYPIEKFKARLAKGDYSILEEAPIQDFIKSLGYDGFKIRDYTGANGFGIFDPSKIKNKFQLANKFKQAAKIPEGYIKGSGILSNYAFPKDVANYLGGFQKTFFNNAELKTFLKYHDEAMRWWKTMATVVSPGFHMRNFFSNIANSWLGGNKNPLNYVDAAKIFKGGGEVTTQAGEKVAGSVVAQAAAERGILKSGWFAGELGGGKLSQQLEPVAKKVARGLNPLSSQSYAAQAGRYAGVKVEEYSRLAHFIDVFKKTGDFDVAAEETFKYLFDYGELTPFWKNVVNRAFPFGCVDEETECLTSEGWKKHNEIKTGDKLFTINLETQKIELQKCKGVASYDYDGELVQLKNRNIDILMTPNHRCIYHNKGREEDSWNKLGWRIKEAKELNGTDWLPIATKGWDENKEEIYSDEFVEIIGWVICEGHLEKDRISIIQSEKNSAEDIKKCLDKLKYKYSALKRNGTNIIQFRITRVDTLKIREIVNQEKDLTLDFILSLSKKQMKILLDTMVKGDGYKSWKDEIFLQKNDKTAENFQILCILLGRNAKLKKQIKFREDRYSNKPINWIRIKTVKNIQVKNANKQNVKYKGIVWCPSVLNGTVFFRRNGIVIPSGQTWLRKNTALQFEQLIKQPAKYTVPLKGKKLIESISEDEAPDETYLPEWLKKEMAIRTPFRDSEDNFIYMRLDLPYLGIGDVTDWRSLLGGITPAAKIPMELGFGKELFTGKAIERYPGYTASVPGYIGMLPDAVKRFLGVVRAKNPKTGKIEERMNPYVEYLLRQNPAAAKAGKLIPFAEQTQYQKTSRPYSLASILGGVGITPYDEKYRKKVYEKEQKAAMAAYKKRMAELRNWA